MTLAHAEVLDSLPSGSLSPQQHRVGAGRCPQSQLIQCQGLSTSIENALPGSLRET